MTAIGRFVLLDELQAAVAGGFDQKLPWMVAIMAVGDVKTLTKLTCFQDWYELTRAPVVYKEPKTAETKASAPSGMLF